MLKQRVSWSKYWLVLGFGPALGPACGPERLLEPELLPQVELWVMLQPSWRVTQYYLL